MVREDLLDGDAFETLANRLGLAYYETHNIDRAGLSGVVLTHNSDGCIVRPDHLPIREYDFVWRDIPAGVTHWFGQNVDVSDPRLTPSNDFRFVPRLAPFEVALFLTYAPACGRVGPNGPGEGRNSPLRPLIRPTLPKVESEIAPTFA